jgi:hypothetical protein
MILLLRRTLLPLSVLVLVLISHSAGAAFSEPAQGLALDETRDLAFSALAGAVSVIDVADPTDPILISDSIQTQGVVQDIHYEEANQLLYIAADEGDLEIWDIQDPADPQQISVTPLFYFGVEVPVVSVDVSGDFAYVSTAWGYLHWLDVSDPANPIDFGFNGQGGNPSRELFLADDGYVYLAGPDTVRYAINANGSLSLAGSNIYATSYELFAASGYVYTSSGTGPIQILDAGQSSLPSIGLYDTNNVKDLFVAGDYAYVANGSAGLRVLDVSDKTNPVEIGFDDSDGATDVIISGDYAYVRSGTTFRVVDVTVPANPAVVGTIDLDTTGTGNIAPIADAGPSQAVSSRARVKLDGSSSYDLDGDIVSYDWTQLSGPAVNLRGADTAKPVFRAPRVKGYPVVTLTFELTVTDDDGATGSDQVTVTVLPR